MDRKRLLDAFIDLGQKRNERDRVVAGDVARSDLTGCDVERRGKRGGAVADVLELVS